VRRSGARADEARSRGGLWPKPALLRASDAARNSRDEGRRKASTAVRQNSLTSALYRAPRLPQLGGDLREQDGRFEVPVAKKKARQTDERPASVPWSCGRSAPHARNSAAPSDGRWPGRAKMACTPPRSILAIARVFIGRAGTPHRPSPAHDVALSPKTMERTRGGRSSSKHDSGRERAVSTGARWHAREKRGPTPGREDGRSARSSTSFCSTPHNGRAPR